MLPCGDPKPIMDNAAVDKRAERLPVVGAAPAGAGEGADIMVFLSGITPLSIFGDGVSDTCAWPTVWPRPDVTVESVRTL